LPDRVGFALLALVTGVVVTLGASLGFGAVDLLVLCALGTAGAFSVRERTAGQRLWGVGGVTLLWVVALGFVVLLALLVTQSFALFGNPIPVALVTAAAALLAPFGVLGSTVRLYGHGAGQGVLGRYLRGTVLLVGIAVALLAGTLLWSFVTDAVVVSASADGVPELPAMLGQVLVAVVVYALALVVGIRVVRQFPAAVLVPPTGFARVERARATAETVYRRARLGLLVSVVLVFVMIAGQRPSARPVRRALYLATLPSVVTLIAGVVVVLALGLTALWLLRQAGGLTDRRIAEIVVPPVVFTLLVGLVSGLFTDAMNQAVERQLARVFGPRAGIYEFLAGQSLTVLLVLLALALLCSAVVLSVPTLVAAQWLGDESLAGVASSVLALVALLGVTLATEQGGAVVVVGVVAAAVVWELGEYTTVAAGELGTEGAPLPGGFGRLASVHTVVTLVVALGGAGLTLAFLAVSGATVLPTGAAALVVALAGVGSAALTLLLIG
jgi:hypothetical protein